MKLYFFPNIDTFTNSYLLVNDSAEKKEALIIDPSQISNEIINQIEEGGYSLSSVLITHGHPNHIRGLKTLMKIYSPKIYAADGFIDGVEVDILNGDGVKEISGFKVEYYSVPGHSSDSMVYKIENLLFTGDTIIAGTIGNTSSKYSQKLLSSKIREKLYSFSQETVIMPGHGTPSSLESEKNFNLDI